MEKIAVAVVVNPQTAARIQKEVIRQAFVDEINDLYKRIHEAGFSLEVADNPIPDVTSFSKVIQIPASCFGNKKSNRYNMIVY